MQTCSFSYESIPDWIGKYNFEHTILGTGNSAVVKLGMHIPSQEKVAIKVFAKSNWTTEKEKKVRQEMDIMKKMNFGHGNITRLFQIMETDHHFYMVTEYAACGDLFDFISRNGRLKEPLAKAFFRQILAAVDYCHSRHVVHRDLKTENILLDSYMNIKLTDFGFSTVVESDELLTEWCGSPPYTAPEIFLGQKYNGVKSDIWSLGVVLYVMVCGSLPFSGDSLMQVRSAVLTGKFRVPFFMSRECEHLISQMLQLKPAKRYSLDSMISGLWLTSNLISEHVVRDAGFEESDELNVFVLDQMELMGVNRDNVQKSLLEDKYDDNYATYHLLNRRLQRDTFSRELLTRLPIPLTTTAPRRSSITTGIVEKRDEAEKRPVSSNNLRSSRFSQLSVMSPRTFLQKISFPPESQSAVRQSFAIADESDEAESDSVVKYLFARNRSLRCTLGPVTFVKRSQNGSPWPYSTNRRNSDTQALSETAGGVFAHWESREVLPIKEVSQLQRRLDSAHVFPSCYSPLPSLLQKDYFTEVETKLIHGN